MTTASGHTSAIRAKKVIGTSVKDTSGETIGKILVPETVTNLAFGGPKRNRLFITAASSLYSIYVGTSGL